MKPARAIDLLCPDRTTVMGIVNITPDSFSDGGRYLALEAAKAHAARLLEEGADLLDIGGESTRPGSEPVSEAEECRRVLPLVQSFDGKPPVPLSIDTTKARVAALALEAGASIINDVSGGLFEPDILDVCAKAEAIFVVGHTAGPPKTMQSEYHYDDVVAEIEAFFTERLATCEAHGLPRERVILDPGIGFGKSVAHNLLLLKAGARFAALGCPVLIGASRKRFIGELSGAPVGERLEGSLAALGAAVAFGAQMVRVHDVLATRRFLAVWDAIQRVRPDGGMKKTAPRL